MSIRTIRSLASSLTLCALCAAPALADTWHHTMGQPTKDGPVKIVITVTLDDHPHTRVGPVTVTANITAAMTPEEKAQEIVDNFYPVPHPWIELTRDGAKVVATSKAGYQLEGLGTFSDGTAESNLPAPSASATDVNGVCSLSEFATGLDAMGGPGMVTVVVGPAVAIVPTFPGMPADLVEDEVAAQLGAMGVMTHLSTPADELAYYGDAFAGDGRAVVIEGVDVDGIFVDVTDVGLIADAIAVIDRDKGPAPIGTNYCIAETNSTEYAAQIIASGSDVVADGDLTLVAVSLPPNQFGYFLASKTEGFVAHPGGSAGNLCLGGQIGRFNKLVKSSGSQGMIEIEVDPLIIPVSPPAPILPGETWRFQCWFRDIEVAPTSNFTDGIWIEWQ